jgi:type II secretory pathway pseudopilin PulG
MFSSLCHRVRERIRSARHDAGFTLLEAVVSFALLAIMSGASLIAMVNADKAAATTTDRVTASNLAQQDLEAARALQYPSYPVVITASPVTVGGTVYTVSQAITTTCPALWVSGQNLPTSMQVTATVTWPGAKANVVMATLISC